MKFKEEYKKIVDDIKPSAEFINKIQISEDKRMKKFSKKKVAIVAAVACMAIGTTAFAAGHIATYRSWSNPQNVITNYADAVTKSDELGANLIIPQAFSNGYSFDAANTMGMEGLDDSGKVMVRGTDFTARYVKDSMPDINMFIHQVYEENDENYAVSSETIRDVEVYFNQATYKFVPEGYELTDEDRQNMDDPHFEISEGSDTVEIMNFTGISFEKDGEYYNMFAWDSDMTADEWYEMAEELLAQ